MHRSPLALLTLLLAPLLLLPACKGDEGPERLARADARYAALVESGLQAAPQASGPDPRLTALIQEYEAIPHDSKAWPQAQKRLDALRALSHRPPPRPLAVPGSTGPGASAADLQRAACARLAEQLGAASPEGRPALEKALGECRERQARYEAHEHAEDEGEVHPVLPDGGAAPH